MIIRGISLKSLANLKLAAQNMLLFGLEKQPMLCLGRIIWSYIVCIIKSNCNIVAPLSDLWDNINEECN